MKTLELEVDELKSPGEVMNFFKKNEMGKGDTLRIFTREENIAYSVLSLIVLAIEFYFIKGKVKQVTDGNKLLDSLFKGESTVEMEKQVEEEYGVKIVIESHEEQEHNEWGILSRQGLGHAYGDNEPEYSDADIKIPNPDFKEWKKAK
jgi:hypothetical protein